MARNGNGSRMPTIGNRADETSYPCPDAGRIANRGDTSLAVQDNANVANFIENPDVFNESPATKKSYSWNRGDTGNVD
jgi:hypothetical protein